MKTILLGKFGIVCAAIGICCSSWIVTSRGSSQRSFICPMGNCCFQKVRLSNIMCSRTGWRSPESPAVRAFARTILLCQLLQACGGIFILEQPSSSLLARHDRMVWLVQTLEKLSIRAPWQNPIHQCSNELLPCAKGLGRIESVHRGMNIAWVDIEETKIFVQDFWMKAWGHPTAKRTLCYSNSALVKALDAGRLPRALLESNVRTTRRYVSKSGKQRFTGTPALRDTQNPG